MLDFTAIDFETANSFRGSPCSVGLVRVRDGQIIERVHWLIRPPEGADWFDGWNTAIHGITPEMVADAPRWKDILPAIVDFIGDDVLVAHNAGFDLGVMRYACALDNIEWPEVRFLCTLVMSRRALALPTYRLPFLAETMGIAFADHHDALADATAVVEVTRRLAAKQQAVDLLKLADSLGVGIGRMGRGIYRGSVATGAGGHGGRNFTPIEVNAEADPSGYLYGRVIVFTGTLMSMTRDTARQECAKVGAIPEQSTTKRTNVLVVGDINPAVLRPGSNITGKARKAFELQDSGQEIEVMTEDDFLRCLDGNRLDGAEVLLDDGAQHAATQMNLIQRNSSIASVAPTPKPAPAARLPRPLRRTPVPTDQTCSVDGCESTAAFKTRTKATWCHSHIEEIQRTGGLRPLETFTHPDDWQLTECLVCSVQAHYRFNYTLDKNAWNEGTCRACYWRKWAADARRMQGDWADLTPVSYSSALAHAEAHGFEYLGPLTAPSYGGDPHHVKCRACGKISADRLSDVGFGCTCHPRE
ncbi:3'-5' exoribonuclease [Microbacterium trichothecenolyticum]|uniref:exonuclease domain-containing protein n=1 Tax=Microbacterium trichothecenolyticum TaxID=69370 RepID=UPI001C6EEE8F|nr:exonuclease domain-containing protein [Microbacterium trichothecenolyticum]MBW9121242.1 3'-5' exoribonuclease [Microbacterium trichothecenolyticum]